MIAARSYKASNVLRVYITVRFESNILKLDGVASLVEILDLKYILIKFRSLFNLLMTFEATTMFVEQLLIKQVGLLNIDIILICFTNVLCCT